MDVLINHVEFSYPGTEKIILEDVSLNVKTGDFVCILGQSGCGKSTLLRLLAGLETPNKGELLVDGRKIEGAGLDRGVVFQDYGVFPWKKAVKNITLAIKKRYPRMSAKETKDLAVEWIEKVGLSKDVYDKLPKELSGGMKQRCAIARAFSLDSPILLMDEPFGALDAVTRSNLQDMLLDLWSKDQEKKTVFFVTHDVDEAIYLGTHICVLGQSPSKVICEETIDPSRKPTRTEMYESAQIQQLRNRLIKHINVDVASHQ